MCIFKNQEKIKQDNIFSIMTKSLDISRLFGQSSFIFLKNISGLISNRAGGPWRQLCTRHSCARLSGLLTRSKSSGQTVRRSPKAR